MSINQIKNKTGTVWRARLVLKSGRRISKCFPRKVDADQWLAKAKVENGDPTQVRREPIRFCDLADQFLKYKKSELQIATYQRYEAVIRRYLIPEFGRAFIDSISKKDVMDFKVKVSEMKLSQATKYFVFCSLKTVIRNGIEMDLTTHNPTIGIKSPKKGEPRTEYWSLAELQTFLNRISSHPRFPLYVLALNTGMRAGEIFGLQWDCIDLENELILIKRMLDQKTHILKETTKTKRFRNVGINDAVKDLLRGLSKNRTSDYVLDRHSLGCKNTSHIARALYLDCLTVGVRPIKFHDLRHTFATQLVRKSGDIHAVAHVMGHKSTTMTDRYAHFGNDHAVQVAKMISFTAEEEPKKVVPLRAVK